MEVPSLGTFSLDMLGLDMLCLDVLGLDMLGILIAESLIWLVRSGPAKKLRWETRQFYRVEKISKSDIRTGTPLLTIWGSRRGVQ